MSSNTPSSIEDSGSSSSSTSVYETDDSSQDTISISTSLETALSNPENVIPPPKPYQCVEVPAQPPPPGTEDEFFQTDSSQQSPAISNIYPLYANYSQHAYFHATPPTNYSQRAHPGFPYSYNSQPSPYAEYNQRYYQTDRYPHYYQTAPYPSFSQTAPSIDYSQPAPYQSYSQELAPTATYPRVSYSQAASYYQAVPTRNYSEAVSPTSYSEAAHPLPSYSGSDQSISYSDVGLSTSFTELGPSSSYSAVGPPTSHSQTSPSATSSLTDFRGALVLAPPRRYPKYSQTFTVRVNNLNFSTTLETLRYHFRPFGPLGDLYISRDPITEASKGYAFVKYYDRQHAVNAANAMTGTMLDGNEISAEVLAHATGISDQPGEPTPPGNQEEAPSTHEPPQRS